MGKENRKWTVPVLALRQSESNQALRSDEGETLESHAAFESLETDETVLTLTIVMRSE